MKLVKMLTPVILTGLLSLPAFAAEDQGNQMPNQGQYNQQPNQQLAADEGQANSVSDAAGPDQKAKTTQQMHHKGSKCKCKHKTKGKKADQQASAGETQTIGGEVQSDQNPAS